MKTDAPFTPPPQLVPEVRERLRARSKLLFGNRDRLEVAAAIAANDDALVNATEFQWKLGIANNRIRAQLIALAELDLLTDGTTDGGKRWYLRLDSPMWECFAWLYEQWSQ
jgi:hypothetical protein